MSTENRKIGQRFNEEFNRRGWDALRDFGDPDMEFHEPPDQPGAGVFRGLDAVLVATGRFAEAWRDHHSTPERVFDLGDTLVVLTLDRFRGRDGIELEQHTGHVMTFRDGKIVRWAAYYEPQKALEAVGLAESETL